jgi:hypothetical protein
VKAKATQIGGSHTPRQLLQEGTTFIWTLENTVSWLPASAGRWLAHGLFRLKAEATQAG